MPTLTNAVAFSIFGIDIRWYALFLLAGLVAGVLLTRFLAQRLGLDPEWVLDASPLIVLSAIVGARIYYVILRADYFAQNPSEIINTRLGGMAFHGALAAGFLAFLYLCRRDHQPILRWSDAAIPGVALAQGIGRWGNWANQEAFGAPTSLPWGMVIAPEHRPPIFAEVERFHPTFLYESMFNLLNALFLSWLALQVPTTRRLRHGDILGVYLINYGVARFAIERLRVDSLYIGPLPAAFWLSWVLVAVGVAVLAVPRFHEKRGIHANNASLV